MLTKLAMPKTRATAASSQLPCAVRAENEDSDERERHHLECDRDRSSRHCGAEHLQRMERRCSITAEHLAFALVDDRDRHVRQAGQDCDVRHHRRQVVVDRRDVLRADLGRGDGDTWVPPMCAATREVLRDRVDDLRGDLRVRTGRCCRACRLTPESGHVLVRRHTACRSPGAITTTATTSSCWRRDVSVRCVPVRPQGSCRVPASTMYALLSVLPALSTTPMFTDALPPPSTLPSSTMRKIGMSNVKMSAARLRKLLRTVVLTSASQALMSAARARSAR